MARSISASGGKLGVVNRLDDVKTVQKLMTLFLSTGAVQFDMPRHLIGPGDSILPGMGDIDTAIAADLRFVKMG